MRVYIEPTLAYNELEQELQILELSSLIENSKGEIILEKHLEFEPVYGIDTTLLNWLEKRQTPVSESNSREEVSRCLEEINSLIEEQDSYIISWNDIFKVLGKINSIRYISVKSILPNKTTLKKEYENITGKKLNSNKSRDRLYATKLIYEYHRGKINKSENEIKTIISENIHDFN